MTTPRQLRSDAGTTAVEFALVAVVILTIALGAVDLGLWVFQKSEAEQAAREASRIAMLAPPSATGVQTSGSIYDAALAETESNLPQFQVSVTCASTCAPGDTVTVTVSWHREPLTFVGVTDTVTGSSTRTVVGTP
jgi:Flp pilus assembly protein TadG